MKKDFNIVNLDEITEHVNAQINRVIKAGTLNTFVDNWGSAARTSAIIGMLSKDDVFKVADKKHRFHADMPAEFFSMLFEPADKTNQLFRLTKFGYVYAKVSHAQVIISLTRALWRKLNYDNAEAGFEMTCVLYGYDDILRDSVIGDAVDVLMHEFESFAGKGVMPDELSEKQLRCVEAVYDACAKNMRLIATHTTPVNKYIHEQWLKHVDDLKDAA